MPTVEMKLPARKAASLKRTSRQVFPTPESPTSITCTGGRKRAARTSASGGSDARGRERSQSSGAAILEALGLGQGVRGAGRLRPEQGQRPRRAPGQSCGLMLTKQRKGDQSKKDDDQSTRPSDQRPETSGFTGTQTDKHDEWSSDPS